MEHRPDFIDNYISLIYEQKGENDAAVQHDLIALREVQPRLDTAALLGVYEHHEWQPYLRTRTGATLSTSTQHCAQYEIGVDDLRINDLDHAFDSFQHALDWHCFYMTFIRVDTASRNRPLGYPSGKHAPVD